MAREAIIAIGVAVLTVGVINCLGISGWSSWAVPRTKAPNRWAAGTEVVRHHRDSDFDPLPGARNIMG